MKTIKDYLEAFRAARLGRDVQKSMVDCIEMCYKDATGHPESVAAVVEENEVLRQRVDQLMQIPEGSTSSDAVSKSLNDIRVDADGVTHQTPGNAVREFSKGLVRAIEGVGTVAGIEATESLHVSPEYTPNGREAVKVRIPVNTPFKVTIEPSELNAIKAVTLYINGEKRSVYPNLTNGIWEKTIEETVDVRSIGIDFNKDLVLTECDVEICVSVDGVIQKTVNNLSNRTETIEENVDAAQRDIERIKYETGYKEEATQHVSPESVPNAREAVKINIPVNTPFKVTIEPSELNAVKMVTLYINNERRSIFPTLLNGEAEYEFCEDFEVVSVGVDFNKDLVFSECDVKISAEVTGELKKNIYELTDRIEEIENKNTIRRSKSFEYTIEELPATMQIPECWTDCSTLIRADVSSFETIKIEWGQSGKRYGYIEIGQTDVKTYVEGMQVQSYTHGLTITGFLQVSVNRRTETMENATFRIFTAGGYYEFSQRFLAQANPLVVSGSGIRNASLIVSSAGIDKDNWLFGDSYILYWVAAIGKAPNSAKNFMAIGHAGAHARDQYDQLMMLLQRKIPKRIIWALGMNDPDTDTAVNTSWKFYTDKVIELCAQNGIELILAKIPEVPERYHAHKNAVVESSGHDYLDIPAVVGAEAKGSGWYAGLLASDKVHPSEIGSKVLADYAASKMGYII